MLLSTAAKRYAIKTIILAYAGWNWVECPLTIYITGLYPFAADFVGAESGKKLLP
jgi:hypothetical protein